MSDGSSPSESQAPEAVGPKPGEVIASKYVVESLLGVGGMGVVLAARHIQLNQRVAIKLLKQEAAFSGSSTSRFLREARAAAAITSEHVARVLDVGTLENGLPFIVMEHLSGTDLAGLLDERGRVPSAEAVSLVLQACEAIAEAHSIGIIHRDLKPSNIFVTQRADGTALVKVLDFGISKMQNPLSFAGEEATLTASGSVVGSPAYMSPEQIRSAKKTDARSDVWAMGVILYELVTGANPFIGETIGDTLVKIASEPAPPVHERAPEIPAALASVIDKCLERDLESRTPSIAELARALEPFAAGDASAFVARIIRVSASTRPFSVTPSDRTPPLSPTPTPRRNRLPHQTEGAWQRPPEPPRIRRRVAWILGATIASIGAVIAWGSVRSATHPPPRAPVEEIASKDSAAEPLAPLEVVPPAADAALSTTAPPASSPVTPSAASGAHPSPAHPLDHHRPHHPAMPDAPATPPSSTAHSLDDLLEGRH